MQNGCYSFLSAENKNAKRKKITSFFALIYLVALTGLTSVARADDVTPTPSPGVDLSTIPELTLSEAQKNANHQYQIGDRISLMVDMKTPNLENGQHLSLKLPEGSSKLEDQGWYLDESTQLLNGTFHFIASPIQTGNLTLPTLMITKDDQTIVGRTSSFSIQVAESPKKENKAPELIDPISTSLPKKFLILFIALGLMLVGGISYGIYKLKKKKPHAKPKTIPDPVVDPENIIALKKIEKLYREYPYSIQNLKPLAFGLSETLKDYLSVRFKIDANEATSDELIGLLRKVSVSGDNLREIEGLFRDLDLAKFTKAEAYTHFDERKYLDFKVVAQSIVQKWATKRDAGKEVKPL